MKVDGYKRYKTIHMVINTKRLYFHVAYMSICVTYKDETKAPEGISVAATVTRPASAPSWRMVLLGRNEWQLPSEV